MLGRGWLVRWRQGLWRRVRRGGSEGVSGRCVVSGAVMNKWEDV